mgnify:FL=1
MSFYVVVYSDGCEVFFSCVISACCMNDALEKFRSSSIIYEIGSEKIFEIEKCIGCSVVSYETFN